jgi:hypothetical protein
MTTAKFKSLGYASTRLRILGSGLCLLGCGPEQAAVSAGDAEGSGGIEEGSADSGTESSLSGDDMSSHADADSSSESGDQSATIEACLVMPRLAISSVQLEAEAIGLSSVDIDGAASTPRALVAITSDGHVEARGPGDGLDLLASSFSSISLSRPVSFLLANDVHGDLLITTEASNHAYVFEGDGLGGFELSFSALHVEGQTIEAVVATDFDLDGVVDIAGLLSTGAEPVAQNIVLVIGEPTGSAPQAPEVIAEGEQSSILVTTDHTSDGNPDLVVGSPLRTSVLGLANVGNGDFFATVSVASSQAPRSLSTIHAGSQAGVAGLCGGGEEPEMLAIWHGEALEMVDEWSLEAEYDWIDWMGEADVVGDGTTQLVFRTPEALHVIFDLDNDPCIASFPMGDFGGGPVTPLELDSTDGVELVLAVTSQDGAELAVVDFAIP